MTLKIRNKKVLVVVADSELDTINGVSVGDGDG
jgi:hypothetical protein